MNKATMQGLNKRLSSHTGITLRIMVAAVLLLTFVLGTVSLAAPNAPTGESSLGDRVWHDLNNNGQQDLGEPGINDVNITLYLDDGDSVFDPGPTGDQVDTETFSTGQTTTATNGAVTGYYNYNKITADGNEFWVVIDADNFGSGKPLEGFLFSSELFSAFPIEGEPGNAADPLRMFVPTSPGQFRITIDTADFGFWKPELNLSITPGTATNEVGDPHEFVVTVKERAASGANVGNMVPKQGATPTVTVTDSANAAVTPIANTSTLPLCTVGTNSNGQCAVTINSSVADVYTASASLSATYGTGGANGTVTISRQTGTPANTAAGGTGNASKTYVNLRISIDPLSDTNKVGDSHTFTILVEQKVGAGSWTAVGNNIKPVVTISGSPIIEANTCASPGTAGGTGTCTVRINSDVAAVYTANASVTATVVNGTQSVSITRNTTGDTKNDDALVGSGKTDTASKTYVNLRISIDPLSDTNKVGDSHTFTILVEQKVGAGSWTAVGNNIKPVVTISGSPTIEANTCASPGTAGGTGTCTVRINSDVAAVYTANASVTATVVNGTQSVSITRNTTGDTKNDDALVGSGKTDTASKTYVNLRISISPKEATNPVKDPHTFTILVEQKVGAGSWTAVGNNIKPVVTISGSPTIEANTCASPGTAGGTGTCTVRINSDVAAVYTANASVTATVVNGTQSVSITRNTTSDTKNDDALVGSGKTGTATKTYLAATLGDKVWWDIDKDGIQDGGEPGIEDVTVNLYVGSSTTVYSTTQTNASGIYQFQNLPNNTYRIEIPAAEFTGNETLVNWKPSPVNNPATTDELDSDADPVTHAINSVALGVGATDNSRDFGFYMDTDYTITKTTNVVGSQRLGDEIKFTIQIKNLGTSYLAVVPLEDTYNTDFLEFDRAEIAGVSFPPNGGLPNSGTLTWTDVTGAGQLSPDAPNNTITIDVFFNAVGDTTDTNTTNLDRPNTKNVAKVVNPKGDPDGPTGPLPEDEPLPTKQDDALVQIINPTAVSVASSTLAVDPANGTVTMRWQTVSEAGIAGFNVMRRVDGGAPEQINDQLILAQNPGQPVGSWYTFMDSQASVGSSTTYLLQFIMADGRVVNHELDTVFVGYTLFMPLVIR